MPKIANNQPLFSVLLLVQFEGNGIEIGFESFLWILSFSENSFLNLFNSGKPSGFFVVIVSFRLRDICFDIIYPSEKIQVAAKVVTV